MAEILVQWAPVAAGEPPHGEKTKEVKNDLVNQEVERFSAFMQTLQDGDAKGPLEEFEKALIRSYLVAKLAGKIP